MVSNAAAAAGSGTAAFEFLRREGEGWQARQKAVKDSTGTFVALSSDGQLARLRMRETAAVSATCMALRESAEDIIGASGRMLIERVFQEPDRSE